MTINNNSSLYCFPFIAHEVIWQITLEFQNTYVQLVNIKLPSAESKKPAKQ